MDEEGRTILSRFQALAETREIKVRNAGPFRAILGKGPWPKLGKKSKLGEINDIEHYKGSKIYTQNQVILDCIMPSIPLKHKCFSYILIWVSVFHK